MPAAGLAAFVVDTVFVASGQAVAARAGRLVLVGPRDPSATTDVTLLPVFASVTLLPLALLLGVLYHIYFWSVKGATPGKELLDLRVVTEDGRSPIPLASAVRRALGYLLSGREPRHRLPDGGLRRARAARPHRLDARREGGAALSLDGRELPPADGGCRARAAGRAERPAAGRDAPALPARGLGVPARPVGGRAVLLLPDRVRGAGVPRPGHEHGAAPARRRADRRQQVRLPLPADRARRRRGVLVSEGAVGLLRQARGRPARRRDPDPQRRADGERRAGEGRVPAVELPRQRRPAPDRGEEGLLLRARRPPPQQQRLAGLGRGARRSTSTAARCSASGRSRAWGRFTELVGRADGSPAASLSDKL